MNWVVETFSSSVGKKLLMAVTGLGFVGFIIVHLLGNLTLFAGREAFTAYVDKLHEYELLIIVAEIGLFILLVIHVTAGFILFFSNRSAREVRYAVKKSGSRRIVGPSVIMPYTGVIILVFVLFHLWNFSFADLTDRTMYDVVTAAFSSAIYVAIYVVAVAAVGLHVQHGFWSLFQSLGLNHDKYMPALQALSIILGISVGVGFALIPVYIGLTV